MAGMDHISVAPRSSDAQIPLLVRLIILAGNVAVAALLIAAFFILEWSGTGFALGLISGFALFFVWFRMRSGYWP
jgi:hypothetical protein